MKNLTIILLFLSPGIVAEAQIQALKPFYTLNLIGSDGPSGDYGKSRLFFDAFGYVDPRVGTTTFPSGHRGDTTNGWAQKQFDRWFCNGTINAGSTNQLYYPGNRGQRVVMDMTGAKDPNDTTYRVNLRALYAFLRSNQFAGDTMYFYNLDVMLRVPVGPARLAYLNRPDSMMTPFAKIVVTNYFADKWDSVVVNFDVRYLMIRTVLSNHGSFSTIANYTELSLYGIYQYNTATLQYHTKTAPLPRNTNTIGHFLGTNLGQGIDTAQLIYDGNIRVYGATNYWDNNTGGYVSNPVDPGFLDIGPTQYPAFLRHNQRMWWVISGASKYMENQGHSTTANIDTWGAEPGDPANWTHDGHLFGKLAALYSSSMGYIENYNEWNGLYDPIAYFAKSCADYDSMQVYNPNMKLVMSALTDLDSNQIMLYIWLAGITRSNGKVPWDVYSYHHYPAVYPDIVSPPATPTPYLDHAYSLDEGVHAHGQSFEGDMGIGMRTWTTQEVQSIYNYADGDTTKPIIYTEYGYGNWGTPASVNTVVGYPWDRGNLPSLPGLDSLSFKAELMERGELILPFLPVSWSCEYQIHNASFDTTNSFLLYKYYGRAGGRNTSTFDLTKFWPWWYKRACMYGRMKWWKQISITGDNDTTGLCHAVYMKMDSATGNLTDSIVDIIWKTSMRGVTATNQTVKIGFRKGARVRKYTTSSTNTTGNDGGDVGLLLDKLFLASQDEQATYFFGQLSNTQLYLGNKTAFKLIH